MPALPNIPRWWFAVVGVGVVVTGVNLGWNTYAMMTKNPDFDAIADHVRKKQAEVDKRNAAKLAK
eukprot:scaffold1403_cov180-Ochromonas_danica.AAC.3